MTWNYRIIKHDKASPIYFALHEVYYDDNGKITNWTIEPIDITGETKSEIVKMLKQMSLDSKAPFLKESELAK